MFCFTGEIYSRGQSGGGPPTGSGPTGGMPPTGPTNSSSKTGSDYSYGAGYGSLRFRKNFEDFSFLILYFAPDSR